jgi:DNA-binding beta-propeller fold protein YncE
MRNSYAFRGRWPLLVLRTTGLVTLVAVIAAAVACHSSSLRPGGTSIVSYRFDRQIEIERPTGVAASPDGRTLYVAGARGLSVLDGTGGSLKSVWSIPNDRIPLYVALTSSGEVVATDSNHHSLWRFSSAGQFLGEIAPPDSWSPLGVSAAASGELLVTDVSPGEHRVIVLASDGSLSRAIGPQAGRTVFDYPNQAVLRNGLLYVSDGGNGRVVVFDERGRFLYEIDGLDSARGLDVDPLGLMFVACRGTNDVIVFRTGATQAEFASRLNVPEAMDAIDGPTGVALDSLGRVYVADTNENRVIIWKPNP